VLEKALETDPGNLAATQVLVGIELKEHKPEVARARIETAQAAAPANVELKILSAQAYAAANNLSAAEQSLRRALEIDPNNLQVYGALARVYAMQQRLPEATAEFVKLAERQPKAMAPLTLAGVLLQLQNKPNEAKALFQKALDVDSRAAVAANNLAWLYAEDNEKLDIALQLAQTAKAGLPDRHEVDDTLGWVYYKKGLSTLAVAAFQRSVHLQPDNPSYVGHLGLAYAQSGDKDKARQTLERALKIKADFDGADEARKILKSIV
jgi:tetratricopeptide (TPR) repeat protein